MPDDREYLARLRRLAQGGLAAEIKNQAVDYPNTPINPASHAFMAGKWQGYLDCLDVIEARLVDHAR